MNQPPLIPCLLGPTGAGKTAAALALAKEWPITVINADSRQVYRDFPLITAQPSQEEQQQCPHLLYGFLPTTEKISAGEYARMATTCIAEEQKKKRLPLLVGGTGLYLKTLFEGIASIPAVPAEIFQHWQDRCEKEGSAALHALLETADPAYAAKIHPNDKQRIARALEVWEATGKPLSWWHRQPAPEPPIKPLKIGIMLTLNELKPILKKRIDLMVQLGAFEEAQNAMRQCDDVEAPGWSGIGCREVYGYLKGTMTREECLALWLKQTRAYAKRQLTWFRREQDITWFAPHQLEEILAYCKTRLNS